MPACFIVAWLESDEVEVRWYIRWCVLCNIFIYFKLKKKFRKGDIEVDV